MTRGIIGTLAALAGLSPAPVPAQTCILEFTVEVTRGVGDIRPGDVIEGRAEITTLGQRFRQEGGATAWLADGTMSLGAGISAPIWALVVTSRGAAADSIGIFANEVEGLSVAGIAFSGPMALTLYGRPGTRPEPTPPMTQEDWDRLDLRRAFTIAAQGYDMLIATVPDLTADCH